MNSALEAIVGLGTLTAAGIAVAVWGHDDATELVNAIQHISTNGYMDIIKPALPFIAYLGTAALGIWSIKRAIKGDDRYTRVN